MVIATFVLVASGLTALLFFTFVDTAPPAVSLQAVEEAGATQFKVVGEHGGLKWDDLRVSFMDQSGADHAALLEVPAGKVREGDAIRLRSGLPGGPWALQLFSGDLEVGRLTFTV
jgi:hypothetical protein